MVDKFVNADIQKGKLAESAYISGNKVVSIVTTFETVLADGNGSVYRLTKGLNPNLIPIDIRVFSDALGTGAVFALGLFEGNGGKVISANYFATALSLVAANITPLNGLVSVDIANLPKKLFEHAGHTIATKKDSYDIGFTATNLGVSAGTVSAIITCVQG